MDPSVFPGSIDQETGLFLYAFTQMIKPKIIAEIGTHKAISTIWFASALRETGLGEIHTFDLFECTSEKIATNNVEKTGLLKYVHFHKMPSIPHGASLLKKRGLKIDLLFIDGDHRFEACCSDLLGFWDLLNEGGYLILHDTNLQSGWEGPRLLIDLLRDQHSTAQFPCIDMSVQHVPGMSIIQKMDQHSRPKLFPGWAYLLYCIRSRFRFWLKG